MSKRIIDEVVDEDTPHEAEVIDTAKGYQEGDRSDESARAGDHSVRARPLSPKKRRSFRYSKNDSNKKYKKAPNAPKRFRSGTFNDPA